MARLGFAVVRTTASANLGNASGKRMRQLNQNYTSAR